MNTLIRFAELLALLLAIGNLLTGDTDRALTWAAIGMAISAHRRLDAQRQDP